MTTVHPTSRATAWHEASHTAALLYYGLVPACARIDWPSSHEAGRVEFDWGDGITRESARAHLVATILGAECDQSDGWNDWPPDTEEMTISTADAFAVHELSAWLKFDAVDWSQIRYETNKVARHPRFRRLTVAIADALERREVLQAADLQQILDEENAAESSAA